MTRITLVALAATLTSCAAPSGKVDVSSFPTGRQLTADEIRTAVSDKSFYGRPRFKGVPSEQSLEYTIRANGTLYAVGWASDRGTWTIDPAKNTFCIVWLGSTGGCSRVFVESGKLRFTYAHSNYTWIIQD
jgi:hypothetical protein